MDTIKREAKTQDVMDAMDVSQRTVQSWIALGCPVTLGKTIRGNRFDLGEVAAWMKTTNHTGEAGRPPEVVSVDLEAVRIRKEAAMAENWEHRNAIIRRDFVSGDEVKSVYLEEVNRAKAKLVNLPADISGALVGLDAAEIQVVLESRITHILNDLASGLN